MAGEFKGPPEQVLDKDATLALLASGRQALGEGMIPYRIKSQWLCDLLNEREKVAGYQYNREFQRWFEKEYDLPEYGENNSVLSLLVYNAQSYRHSDNLRAAGWMEGTQELLAQAFAEKRKIEYMGANILCQATTTLLTVREINGKLYAMRPRKRKHAVSIIGEPVRLEGSGPVFKEQSGIIVITKGASCEQ